MSDDDIDRLYGVPPDAFTALRTELVAAAKARGDKDAAKRIGAARRPTVAAWVVNVLVRSDARAVGRLSELGDELRAAHASMDGGRIRQLSSAQRKLIDELVRAGFAAAEMARPSATVRDDVVGTLQAAIADPEVLGRLGLLSTAERWSGFGEFGAASAVGGRSSARPAPADPVPPTEDEAAEATASITAAQDAVDAAEGRHTDAADTLAERETRMSTARRRYEKLLEKLTAAEQELSAADTEHTAAEDVARTAAEVLQAARAQLAEAEADLAARGGAGT